MTRPLAWLALLPVAAALVFTDSAFAHATLSPPTVLAQTSQVFTLAVPTEKEGVDDDPDRADPARGLRDRLVRRPRPAGSATTDQSGAGEDVAIRKVTWSGGSVPTGEAAVLQFVGDVGAAQDYDFKVRQTYSDGTVVDWTGAAGSDTPAPTIEAKTLARRRRELDAGDRSRS